MYGKAREHVWNVVLPEELDGHLPIFGMDHNA